MLYSILYLYNNKYLKMDLEQVVMDIIHCYHLTISMGSIIWSLLCNAVTISVVFPLFIISMKIFFVLHEGKWTLLISANKAQWKIRVSDSQLDSRIYKKQNKTQCSEMNNASKKLQDLKIIEKKSLLVRKLLC